MNSFIQENFFPDVDTIYHYCSTDTFMNIIKKKQLWLTDISKMDDSAEENWAFSLIKSVYEDNKNTSEIYPQDCFEGVAKSLTACSRKFISCFSEEADILSQWRAYADDGAGFSMGFSVEKLKITKNIINFDDHPSDPTKIYLLKVLYEQDKQKEFISRCIKRVAESPGEEPYQSDNVLPNYAIALKNPTFAEEKEWRLILPVNTYAYDLYLKKNACNKKACDEFLFRETCRGISPYITYTFDSSALTEVKLGPKNKATKQDIKLFLNKYGFTNVKIDDEQPSRTFKNASSDTNGVTVSSSIATYR